MNSGWEEMLEKYKGRWLALKDDEKTVVGIATSAEAAIKDAENNGYSDPILFHVLGITLQADEQRGVYGVTGVEESYVNHQIVLNTDNSNFDGRN